MRLNRAVPLALAALAVVVGAIALLNRSSSSSSPSESPDAGLYVRVHAALCESLALVAAGDEQAGRGVFGARSHTALHSLAADVAETDRSVAARLLEAKAAVEASLPAGSSGAANDLRRLAAAAADAVETVTGERPRACN